MQDFSWTTFLSSLVGSGATAWLVVKGLGSHLADRWLARYKGELDKEFEKYRDALIPPDEEGRLKLVCARLSHFRPLLDAFVTTVESAYPFVPDNIYEQLEICMRTGMIEMRHIDEAGARALSPSGYDDGEKQHEKFTKAYFSAATLVRERLKQLSEI